MSKVGKDLKTTILWYDAQARNTMCSGAIICSATAQLTTKAAQSGFCLKDWVKGDGAFKETFFHVSFKRRGQEMRNAKVAAKRKTIIYRVNARHSAQVPNEVVHHCANSNVGHCNAITVLTFGRKMFSIPKKKRPISLVNAVIK